MNMTRPKEYAEFNQADKDDFIKAWILANHHNVNIRIQGDDSCKHVQVQAVDKQTDQVICQYNDTKEDLGNLRLYANPEFREDFRIKIVAKPGDKVFMIQPQFNDPENFGMFMNEADIKEVTVDYVSGASDLDVTIRAFDENKSGCGVVQQACFRYLEDAKEACRRTPKTGFRGWNEYIKAVEDITTYDYELSIGIRRGDIMVIEREDDIYSSSTEEDAETVVHKVRASRIVFECTKHGNKVNLQLTPWMNYCRTGNWVNNEGETAEVVVTPKGLGYTLTLEGLEVYNLVTTYKTSGTLKFVGQSDITVSARELSKLRKAIEDKQLSLFQELAKASGVGDDNLHNYLKQLQLQCSAELRILYYLEHNQGNIDKFVIC